MTRTRENPKYQRIDGSRPWAARELPTTSDDSRAFEDAAAAAALDVGALDALESALTQRSLYEPLTGLANRRLLGDRLQHAIRRCAVQDSVLTVLFLDLDNFTSVNESYGRGAGDALLVNVAALLQTEAWLSDTIARVGADEFVIVSELLTNVDDAQLFANRLRTRIGAGFVIDGQWVGANVSIGVAIGRAGEDAEVLLTNAALAMRGVKEQGGGRVGLFRRGRPAAPRVSGASARPGLLSVLHSSPSSAVQA
jgi:diguanylate cyclase (GGDEF)-like protein